MEFRILGPLCADAGTGQGPASIRQPLLQSALAVLLLRANMTCSQSWLIDALWGSEPPTAPPAALRVCISRLRRDLGGCAVRLETVGPAGGRSPGHRLQRGYRMVVRPGELDSDEFTDLAAQGKAELDMGNAAAAASVLRQALSLWGDPPLPNLPGTPAVASASAELREKRSSAIDDLIEARLTAAEYEQVIGELRAAVIADPGRERTYVQLMRAYHALGMRKEALDVYRRARQAMLAELGAEPGTELALLHRKILAHELAAEAPTAQLSRLEPIGPLRLPAWQVPAPPSDFTGRACELGEIVGGLTGPGVPVTVVTGGPGTGKTVTAATAAFELRSAFPDGQLYAELGGVEHPRDPQQVLADILTSLGIPPLSLPLPGPGRSALYRSLLADRKVLVVADDAATARQVYAIMPAARGAAVLVTSRSRLGGLAAARVVELGGLPADDALALLSSIVGADRVGVEPVATAAVLRACSGLPLALRLAGTIAARPGMTMARLATDLAGDHLLDALATDQMSVTAAIGSSFHAVSEPAQAALSLAAVSLPGDVPAWVLSHGPSHGPGGIADQLTGTGLMSAVQVPANGACFRMHPLVRAYAAQRWPRDTPQSRQSAARLRAGFLLRAEQAATRLPAVPFIVTVRGTHELSPAAAEPTVAVDWFEAERANLLAVTESACEAGDHVTAAVLASRLITAQCLLGRFADAVRVWRAITSAAARDSADDLAMARAAYYLAVAHAEGHYQAGEADRLLAWCIPVLERSGDLATAAMGHGLLARCASASGRHALAIRSARQALRLAGCQDADGEFTRCAARAVLGVTLARVGMTRLAQEQCQYALKEARDLGEPAYEAAALRALAQVLILGRDHTAAAKACEMGASIAREYGSEVTAGRFLVLLGRARQRTGDWVSAAASLRAALEIFCTTDSAREEVTASSLLAACLRSAGDDVQAAEAAEHIGQALARNASGPAIDPALTAACEQAAR
jgi:DNA-binding SARP family transcriptional activator